MKIKNTYKEAQEKNLKYRNKLENKIRIIEENPELSEEEKQKLYAKLIRKLDRELARIEKSEEVKGWLYYQLGKLSEDQIKNLLVGGWGTVTLLVGVVGCLVSQDPVNTTQEVLKIGSVAAVGLGGSLMALSAANSPSKTGDSYIEDAATKYADNIMFKKQAIKFIKEKLAGLMNEKTKNVSLEM